MICHKCNKGILSEQILLKGFLPFFRKKIIVFYCSNCDFKKEIVFKLSGRDLLFEEKRRKEEIELKKLELENTKTKKVFKNEDINKKYNQEYKRNSEPQQNITIRKIQEGEIKN